MKHIGIVCEGPTDYIILKGVIDQITGEKTPMSCSNRKTI